MSTEPGPDGDGPHFRPIGKAFDTFWEPIADRYYGYLSAAHWLPPRASADALSWIESRQEDVVYWLDADRAVVLAGLVRRHLQLRLAQLVVLPLPDDDETWAVSGLAAARRLLYLAFARYGLRRCEWHLPRCWSPALEVAARLRFQEEAVLPQACLDLAGRTDLVVAGLLLEEWEAGRPTAVPAAGSTGG